MKVLFVSGIGGDTQRYRCRHHQEQLALHGIASDLRAATAVQLYEDVVNYDFFVLHRVAYSELISYLIKVAHLRGKPVVFDTDDLVFDPALYDQIGYTDTLDFATAQRFKQDLSGQAETVRHCDAVLTTTQFLADAAAKQGKRVYIQRNGCSAAMVEAAEAAYQLFQHPPMPEDQAATAPLVLGYFSGTGSHNRDFATITPALITIMRAYPQVQLRIGGYLDLHADWQAYQDRIQFTPFVAWQELPNFIAHIDINLAPLELDNPFCQAKSELKYMEAALLGVPTLASPTEAFQFAITPNENGLLAATYDEWCAGLRLLIEQPALRRQLGSAARAHIYAEYRSERRSQQLLATFQSIQSELSAALLDPDTALRTVATTLKTQMIEMTEMQRQQAQQLTDLRLVLASWECQQTNRAAQNSNFWHQRLLQTEQHHVATLEELLARLQTNDSSV